MDILNQDIATTLELLEDFETKKRIVINDIAALKARLVYLRAEERREYKATVAREKVLLKKENFSLVGVEKVNVPNEVLRRSYTAGAKHIKADAFVSTGKGHITNRLAWWWGAWNQYDNHGNLIRVWSLPVLNPKSEYPDFFRQRFYGYAIHSDHGMTRLPAWMNAKVYGDPNYTTDGDVRPYPELPSDEPQELSFL